MKKVIALVILSLTFILSGTEMSAQRNSSSEYRQLDEHPTFRGGTPNAFSVWVANRLKYPKDVKYKGIGGTVRVSFVIGENGRIVEAKVVEGIVKVLDDEAVRVVMKSPKWKPGKKNGKPVRVRFTIPVVFTPPM